MSEDAIHQPQYGPEAKYAVEAEAGLPLTKYEQEIARGLERRLTTMQGSPISSSTCGRPLLTPAMSSSKSPGTATPREPTPTPWH